MTPSESIRAIGSLLRICDADKTHLTIILQLRLPRVLVSLLAGSALGLAGLLSQTLFRNDLADPYIAGIGSGAVLGVNLVLLFGVTLGVLGFSALSVAAFLGAWASCLIIWAIAGRIGSSSINLVLGGVALSFVFSGVNFLIVMVGRDVLQRSTFWSWNGLASSSWSGVVILSVFLGLSLLLLPVFSRSMNAYLLGDEQSTYLGVNPKKLRTVLFLFTSALTGVAIATSGLLGFVGLITPHLARRFVGGESKTLIITTPLLGAIILGIADFIGRIILPSQEISASHNY